MDSEFVTDVISFDYDGHSITQRLVCLDTPSGRLVGILSGPENGDPAPFCLVSVDAGTLRRTSPSRMWTELCRRCAARGIPALRFDFAGIGDSHGRYIFRAARTALDERRITSDQLAFHDYLQQRGVADAFATIRLLLGRPSRDQIALKDRRVLGSILINPVAIAWTPEQARDRDGVSHWRRYAKGWSRGCAPSAHRASPDSAVRSGHLSTPPLASVRPPRNPSSGRSAMRLTISRKPIHRFCSCSRRTSRCTTNCAGLGVLAGLEKWPNVQVEQWRPGITTSDP